MAHNYYSDYSAQYSHNQRAGTQAELSEMGVQGLSYCAAVLFGATAIPHLTYVGRSANLKAGAWPDIEAALNSVRASLLRHDFADAMSVGNSINTEDAARILDNLRPSFLDLEFGDTFTEEIYTAAGVQDATNAAEAVLKTYPALSKNERLLRELLVVLSNANRLTVLSLNSFPIAELREQAVLHPYPPILVPYAQRIPFLLTARNPTLIPIAGIALACAAGTMLNVPGRVGSGPITDDTKFTPQTAFSMPLKKAEDNNYIMLRRLRRGGASYVAHFDIYLTYITDICRMLEAAMPESAREAIQSKAELYTEFKFASRPGIR